VTPDPAEQTLTLAADVAAVLASLGARPALIGAGAMAVHHYARQTEDLDLVVSEPLARLREIADELRRRGFPVELFEPDAEDPLGGVLTVTRGGAGPVQVVNLDSSAQTSGHPRLGRLATATAEAQPGLPPGLRVVTLPALIALKLYAGGPKSELDVRELLRHNPSLDRGALRTFCADLGLAPALEELLSAGD
jgi:hypothetical protein